MQNVTNGRFVKIFLWAFSPSSKFDWCSLCRSDGRWAASWAVSCELKFGATLLNNAACSQMMDGIQQCGLHGGQLGILGLQPEMTQMHVCGLQAEMTQTESHRLSIFVVLDLGTPMTRYDGVCIRSNCPKKLTSCTIRSEWINR